MDKSIFQQRMAKVVSYIEEHLDNDLDVNHLMKVACYSEFHFHRLFRAFVGESIYGFKKRLLLERAVRQLKFSQNSIIDISAKSGYDNQSSFNKAFKKQFLVTPSQVRTQKVILNYPTFKMTHWEKTMEPKIEKLKKIKLICAREKGSYAEAAPKAWQSVMQFAYSNRLMNKQVRLFGISHDDPSVTEPEHIRYDACLDIEVDIANQKNLISQNIEAGQYAVYLHKGSYDGFVDAYAYLFNQWLPNSGYILRDTQSCFEIYLNRDPRRTKPENLRTEIYLPLI